MPGIGRNRVFDSASIEELKNQASRLLKSAGDVTEELKTQMEALKAAAAAVPGEARHEGLEEAASALAGELHAEPYLDMEVKLSRKLEELNAQIPAYDSESAAVLSALSTSTKTLTAMLEELKGMIKEGSLNLSLPEFTEKLTEYETRWEQAVADMADVTGYVMTYLKGLVLTSAYSKDPVNLSTGNFYYEKEDLKINGPIPLTFRRWYNAMDKASSVLGEGWSHTDSAHLSFPGGKAVLHKDDGREIPLKETEDGYLDAYSGKHLLTKEESGYRSEEGRGTFLCFDAEGRLAAKEDRDGNRIVYTHDERGKLLRAQMVPAGADGTQEGLPYLSYTYRGDGMLERVCDHTGRSVGFFYMEGSLMEVTDPEGNVTGYRYGENGKIRAVKNAAGTLTVRNEYDENGRVVRQRFPDKSEMTYAYDDKKNTTTLTERNGALTTYVQDKRLRNVKTIYHDSEESRSYNDRDLVVSRTDRNGNTTRYTYDDKGNLSGILNALGERTDYTYSPEGRLLTASRCGRNLLKNTYDRRGRLVKTVDGLGRVREQLHDENGRIKTIINPDKSRMELSYDKKGNIISLKDPYGNTTRYTYDGLNRITETTDGNGNSTRYAYDKKDRLIKVVNPEGNTRNYCYNQSGKPTQVTDFDGSTTTITYNRLNRPECLTDKEGRETLRSYDSMWNVEKEISPGGAVTRFVYDMDNRLSRIEVSEKEGEAPVCVLAYTHDPAGNLIKTEAGDNALLKNSGNEKTGNDSDTTGAYMTTAYRYDALNRIISVTDACGGEHTYTYDAFGHVASVTDPAGNKTEYTYDPAGQLTEKKDSLGSTRYEYTELGQIKTITDPAGRKTIHDYEPGGRLKQTTCPDGRTVHYTYDGNGNILSKTDESGYTLTYTYDCMDRVAEVIGSAGEKKTYAYDAVGNVVSMRDAEGNTTLYEYTLGGKLKAVTDALSNRTEYTYDAMDNLILITRKGKDGEEDRQTCYIRDALGRLETMTDSYGMEEHYHYDAFGRMMEKTDRDGYTTAYRYTPDGKTASILYGDGTGVEMQYDALRKLIRIKDAIGITKIERDTIGRPVSITDHRGRTTAYEWGILGERRAVTDPDGKTVTYGYDEQLRLTYMTLPGEEDSDRTITYRYDETGRPSEKHLPGGMLTRWFYDDNGRLTRLMHEDEEGILEHYTYTYDRMGNKTGITGYRRGPEEESGSYGYAYDALGRLAAVTKDGKTLRDYTYDSFGNRIEMKDHHTGRKTACTYDALNRLTCMQENMTGSAGTGTIAEYAYAYDNRGNLIQETKDGMVLHDYAYGAAGRLVSATDRLNQKEAAYAYNGLGQRTSKTVRDMTETARMADRLGKDTETAWEEDYLLDLTKPYHNLLGVVKNGTNQTFYYDNNVTAMEENGHFHYYLADELGSPLRVSDWEPPKNRAADSHKYLTYGYDEFGNDPGKELEQAGIPNPYSSQGEDQPFGYTGYRYDDISSTYFAQAREYQPKTGRFTAEDIIKGNGLIPETLNPYVYCWNSPLGLVDLDGCFPELPLSEMIDLNNVVDKIIDEYADDEKGRELVERYVYGNGENYIINNEEDWNNYIMANPILAQQTGYYLAPIGANLKNGETKEINIETSIIIQDEASHSGYMLLYGSNKNVGGYQMEGSISKDLNGNVTYDIAYTFNDIMDPNYHYLEDRYGHKGLKLLQMLDKDITLKDYTIQIRWSDKTVIRTGGYENEGWLAKMQFINPQTRIKDINAMNQVWWLKRRNGTQAEKTIEFYEQLQNYMDSHPEYYECLE